MTDYAYGTIEEYEKIIGVKVNDAFRIGWDMARTTNALLDLMFNASMSTGDDNPKFANASRDTDRGMWFRSAITGMWYRSREAAGEIDGWKEDGVFHDLADAEVQNETKYQRHYRSSPDTRSRPSARIPNGGKCGKPFCIVRRN